MQNVSDIPDAKKWLLNKLCIDEIQTSAKDIVQNTCQRHASISNTLLVSKELVFENKIDSLYTNILLDMMNCMKIYWQLAYFLSHLHID